MPTVGSANFPYTPQGMADAARYKEVLRRAASAGARGLRSAQPVPAAAARGRAEPVSYRRPASSEAEKIGYYESLLRRLSRSPMAARGGGGGGFGRLPVRPVGDFRNPGVEATVPLREDLNLAIRANPGLGALIRGETPQPRVMGELRGRF